MKDKYVEIDILELSFVLANAKALYEKLKENEELIGEATYTLVAFTLVAQYRKTLTVEMPEAQLMYYKKVVKNLVNNNKEDLIALLKLLKPKKS